MSFRLAIGVVALGNLAVVVLHGLVPAELLRARSEDANLRPAGANVARQTDWTDVDPVLRLEIVAIDFESSIRERVAVANQVEIAILVDVAEGVAIIDRHR